MNLLRERCVLVAVLAATLGACQLTPSRSTDAIEVKKLNVNGDDLAYVEEGQGDTVVFVHGGAGDWRTWEGLRPFIAQKHHYVALSRRYHYPNKWSDDGKSYSVSQHAKDVAAFIRALNVGKVHLVGGSYGGRVAGYVALENPELLRSVVMSEPALLPPTTAAGKAAMADFQKDIARATAAAKSGDAKQAAAFFFNAVLGDPAAFEAAPAMRQERWLDNANSLAPMFGGAAPRPISCEEFGAFKIPVLVMRGENTLEAFAQGNDALIGCLPKGTSTAVVPNAPHVWYPVNAQAGAAAILEFVAKH
jgi:pimeloyl-ACP methyl ester carboxylesterase